MQRVNTYTTGMYSLLSKMSSEIKSFHFGYLSTGDSIFMLARTCGSLIIFRSQKRPANKIVWKRSYI